MAAIATNLLPIEIAKANMWRAKRPWFAGAAAAVVVGVGVSVFASWSNNRVLGSAIASDVEPVDPVLANTMANNDKALQDQEKIKKAFDAVASKGEMESAKTNVESYKRQETERKLWPMVLKDILSQLPQVKIKVDPASPRGDQPVMVLTTIRSEYLSSDDWKTWGMPAPVGGAAVPVVPAAPAMPEASTTPPPEKPEALDHGFGVTIIGYTPLGQRTGGGQKTLNLLRDYTDALLNLTSPPNPPKPYVYDYPTTSHYAPARITVQQTGPGGGVGVMAGMGIGQPQPGGATSGGFTLPWGITGGPYWDVFIPEMMGVKHNDPLPGGGPMGGGVMGSLVDPTKKPGIDPDVPGKPEIGQEPGTLHNYTSFVIHLRVNLKDASAAPAATAAAPPR